LMNNPINEIPASIVYISSDYANEPSYHWLIEDPLGYYH
jgi:hypothetical protein